MVAGVGRIFVAMPLPPQVRLALDHRIAGLSIPGKVATIENWHLTLRFLGAVEETAYDRFLHGLSPIHDEPCFEVQLSGFGGFPRPSRASVVWLGVSRGAEELARLNAITEDAAVSASLPAEERPYRPHLTLARVRPPEDITHLLDETVDLRWRADSVVVYRSHLGRGGARYEPLEVLSLRR